MIYNIKINKRTKVFQYKVKKENNKAIPVTGRGGL
jgi:hypothetical protein